MHMKKQVQGKVLFKKNNESGFVLLELVVVLVIVSLMLIIPTLSIDKMIEKTQVDTFFQELTSNITLMQNHTILNNEETEVRFYKGSTGDIIDFKVKGYTNHPLNREMVIDNKFYTFNASFTSFGFKKETGNITKTGHVSFDTSQGRYYLYYWLGRGRFEIRK